MAVSKAVMTPTPHTAQAQGCPSKPQTKAMYRISSFEKKPDSGITPAAAVPPGVEVVRRQRAGVDYVFVINHTAEPVEFELTGTALLGPQPRGGRVTLDGGAVVVVEEAAGHGQGV